MRHPIAALLTCLIIPVTASESVAEDTYQPQLFQSMKLIYEQAFDKDGPIREPDHWVIRQQTQWTVEKGVLIGRIATPEYQQKMRAIGDGHDGTRPVIFLRPVPQAFVVQLRVRYTVTDKKGRDRGCLLDLGHHVNSFIFGEHETRLTRQKKKKLTLEGKLFPLNEWNDVTIEIKEGALVIQVNDRREVIRDPLITLKTERDFQQIDFKGQDFGTVEIDWVKLYEGIE